MSQNKDYYTIQLHDTDAAGILFFANQLKIVHNVYESMLKKIGFGFRERFEASDFFIPIVHAETDFLFPLTVGDTVEVKLSVENIGETSFALSYELTIFDGTLVGTAKTIHVTIDPKSRKKIPLPDAFRKKLEELRS